MQQTGKELRRSRTQSLRLSEGYWFPLDDALVATGLPQPFGGEPVIIRQAPKQKPQRKPSLQLMVDASRLSMSPDEWRQREEAVSGGA